MQGRSRIILFTHDFATVRAVSEAVGRGTDVLHTRDPGGFESLARQDPAPVALLVDNAVTTVNPIEMLQKLAAIRPRAKRILLSDYCDLGIIVQGLHTGAVQQIVYRPIYPPELLAALGMQNPAPAPSHAAAPAYARVAD